MAEDKKVISKLKIPAKVEASSKDEPIGNPGNNVVYGRFQDEYLGELRYDQTGYEEFDKMRRSDYQVQRALTAVKTPLLSAKYTYLPEDKEDKLQVAQAEFKTNVLKKWPEKKWGQILNEIYSFLPFGWAMFEPTFRVQETKEFGLVHVIDDFGFRVQKTIDRWILDERGKLLSVEQQVKFGDLNNDVTIPKDELMIFTLNQEGSNYEGISLLRSAYGCWKRKYLYLKIDYIGNEKMAIGVPIAYVTAQILDDEKEKARIEAVLEAYTTHEKQYILFPDAMKDGGFIIEKGQYNSEAVNESIKREDLGILDSVMASFLAIGTRQMGGNSQSTSQQDMFLNTLQYIGDYAFEVLDEWVHKCYVMNFGEPEVRLEPSITGVNPKNLKELAEIITKYSKTKWLTASNRDEEKLREELGLPELTPEDYEKIDRTMDPKVDEGEDEDEEEKTPKKRDNRDLAVKRELTEAEMAINLNDIQKVFDKSEANYKKLIAGYLSKMRNKYLADLTTALKQSNREKAIMNIKIGFVAQLRSSIRDTSFSMLHTGQRQAADELGVASSKLADDGKVKRINTKINYNSKNIANDIAASFENNSTVFALGQLDNGLTDEQIVSGTEDSIKKFEASRTPYNSTGVVINQSTNWGRNNFFFGHKDLMQGLQFSAILDDGTTDICRSLDKQTFSPTDAESYWLRPPLHWYCRSILVAVLLGMKAPSNNGLSVKPINGKTTNEILKQRQFSDEHNYCEHQIKEVN